MVREAEPEGLKEVCAQLVVSSRSRAGAVDRRGKLREEGRADAPPASKLTNATPCDDAKNLIALDSLSTRACSLLARRCRHRSAATYVRSAEMKTSDTVAHDAAAIMPGRLTPSGTQ